MKTKFAFCLIAMIAFLACSPQENPQPTPQPQPQPQPQPEPKPSVDTVFQLTLVDPLQRVASDVRTMIAAPDTLPVAKGESATFQVAVVAEMTLTQVDAHILSLTCSGVEAQGISPVLYWENFSGLRGKNVPDALVPVSYGTKDLEAGSSAFLWCEVDIPCGTSEGVYTGQIELNGIDEASETVRDTVDFVFKVYPIAIQGQKLVVANWIDAAPIERGELGQKAPMDSDQWTTYFGKMSKFASRYGNNAWKLFHWVNIGAEDGALTYDFSSIYGETAFLDGVAYKYEYANLAQIHGGHLGNREGWNDQFEFYTHYIDGDGNHKAEYLPADDPRVEAYINDLFPKLQDFLKETVLSDGRRYIDVYAQFVADEPIDVNLAGWEKVASMIKAAAPEIKIVEAYRASTYNRDLLDFPCPQLDEINGPAFSGATRSDNRWFYTSLGPVTPYPNRLMSNDLIDTRILHWVNYARNFTGYLHWGYNHWTSDPFSDFGSNAGDSFISYPGRDEFLPSLRLCTMRDGIKDYELLRMLEERDPVLAAQLCSEIVSGSLTGANRSIRNFRDVRLRMLDALCN